MDCFGWVSTRYIELVENLREVVSLPVPVFGPNKQPLNCGDRSRLAKILYPGDQCFYRSVSSSRRKANPSKRGHLCSDKFIPSSTTCVPAIAWALGSLFSSLFRIALASSYGTILSQHGLRTLGQAFFGRSEQEATWAHCRKNGLTSPAGSSSGHRRAVMQSTRRSNSSRVRGKRPRMR